MFLLNRLGESEKINQLFNAILVPPKAVYPLMTIPSLYLSLEPMLGVARTVRLNDIHQYEYFVNVWKRILSKFSTKYEGITSWQKFWLEMDTSITDSEVPMHFMILMQCEPLLHFVQLGPKFSRNVCYHFEERTRVEVGEEKTQNRYRLYRMAKRARKVGK